MNLETTYLGLPLPHPFVLGACPLSSSLDHLRAAEDAGAAALHLHSMFEEQVLHQERGRDAHIHAHEEAFAEAGGYFPSQAEYMLGPEEYLAHVSAAKAAVSVPIIASLNGTHPGSWVYYAKQMESAGADAIELNLYDAPSSDEQDAGTIEARLLEIVQSVCEEVGVPIAVKISPYFTSIPHLARRFEEAGAKGLTLFNRFYQPDLDLEELEAVPSLTLSSSDELRLRLRWMAMLFGRLSSSLACSGGVRTRDDAIKALMCGADAVQLVSEVLENGVERIGQLREEVAAWMTEKEYTSLQQMKGSMSHQHVPNPEALERANYLKVLQSWKPNSF